MTTTYEPTKVKGGYMCRRNAHLWLSPDDAEKCCDGIHKRVLVLGSGQNQQLCAGVMIGHAWSKQTD